MCWKVMNHTYEFKYDTIHDCSLLVNSKFKKYISNCLLHVQNIVVHWQNNDYIIRLVSYILISGNYWLLSNQTCLECFSHGIDYMYLYMYFMYMYFHIALTYT